MVVSSSSREHFPARVPFVVTDRLIRNLKLETVVWLKLERRKKKT